MIIGNPPYIRHEEITQLKPQLQRAFDIFASTADIYTYFYEQGYKVLKKGALLSFITSNKFCRAGYGENLREFLLENTAISHFVDLNGLKAFESAVVDTCILIFAKAKPTQAQEIQHFSVQKRELDAPNYQQIPQNSLSKEGFIFLSPAERALKDKIEKLGKPLKEWDITMYRGIITGFNDAFIIDTDTKNKILAACDNTIKSPLPCGGGLGVGKTERERTAALIKPVLRGRDIERYHYEWANLWIIGTFPALNLNIDDYPALKNYLEKFMPRLKQSGEKGCRKKTTNAWFETSDNIAYYGDFEKEKIVWCDMSKEASFIWDNEKFYFNNTCYFIINANKYLLGVLNSKLISFYLGKIASSLGEGAFRWFKQFVEKLPIPQINSQNSKIAGDIVNLVEQILRAVPKSYDNPHELLPFDELAKANSKTTKKSPSLAEGDLGGGLSKTATKIHAKSKYDKTLDNAAAINATIGALSKEIDKLVYKLYALTPDEIALIDPPKQIIKKPNPNNENEKTK